jgi:uncharacterized protein
MNIHLLAESAVEPEVYFLAPEKLMSGNPKQSVWVMYTDATEQFFAGKWSSDVGKWRVSYTEEEYCEILEGTSIISSDDGTSVTVTSGDCFVVPRGFHGTWEVVEPTSKKFVIYERRD